ncbi:MAG: leucine-rich repeat domain-containing protein [Christensenellales bacterium]|jgi:hypothetical protein
MKRALFIALFLLLLAALPAPAAGQAEELLTSGDYEYRVLEDGTAEIAQYNGAAESLEIPRSLNGLSVTSIGAKAFFDRSRLLDIAIPDSVVSIGSDAFSWCNNLKCITIPNTVTSIGDWAFSGCENLEDIQIPGNVANIGNNPFSNCANLDQVILQPDHPTLATVDGVLFNKADKRLIWYPIAREDTAYEVPQGVLSIGEEAFLFCQN